ncbi:MAG: hypothetical protein ABL933_06385 [Methyloglobulus sp.]
MKKILLTTASFIGGYLILVLDFAVIKVAEPGEQISLSLIAISILIGVVFSAPLWVLGLIPKHLYEKSVIYRWFVALALIYPIRFFGGSVLNSIESIISSKEPKLIGLIGILPTVFCFLSMGYLLMPEVSKLLPHLSIKRKT